MNLKKAILSVLGRDALRAIVDVLEIEDVDRRSVEDMASALSRAHRATPEMILEHLNEAEVKAVCEAYGNSSTGRRAALIESLLKAEEKAQKRAQNDRRTEAANDRGTSVRKRKPMSDELLNDWLKGDIQARRFSYNQKTEHASEDECNAS